MTFTLALDFERDTGTVLVDGLPIYAMTSRGRFRNYWDDDPGILFIDLISSMTSGGAHHE